MKLDKQKWQTDFERQLDIAEKPQLSKVRRFYKSEYNKGINSFIAEGQTNFQLLFAESDFLKIYRDLYSDIGLRFAKWYARNFDKYLTKGVNPNKFSDQWQNSFASLGSAVGAQRVTLVSGTAKKTLIDITQKLLRDPEFMVLGSVEKGRILKSQFNKYSQYQSERLVRTEATNAANFATMESATTIFPGAQMQKEWIASFDDRTRSSHAEAGASEPIPYNEAFMVGGSLLMYPGDPSGPAAEVVNCRCSVAPFPKQEAQTVGELSGFNFGLASAESTGFGLTDIVTNLSAKELMRPDNWNNVIPNNVKINDDYLSLLKQKPELVISESTNQFGNTVSININKYKKTLNGVLAHEFGHLIHESRGWLTDKITNKIIQDIFKKHRKILNQNLSRIMSQRANKELIEKWGFQNKDALNSLYSKMKYKEWRSTQRKLFKNLSDAEFEFQFDAVRDYLGALTKNQIGGGHSLNYYTNQQWQKFEMVAHWFENKYNGNLVFKKYFPEMYEDSIKAINDLIKLQ